MKASDTCHTPSDRKTISSNHIPSLYDTIKADITRQITNDVHYYSITTDLWISQARQSYIAITFIT